MVHINICVIAIWDLKSFSQTHTLNGSCLAQLASLFVDAIKAGKMGSGKSLELFPTVLTALSACDALSYGKGKCKLLDSVNVKCKSPVSYVVLFSVRCRSYNTVNIRLFVANCNFRGTEWRGIQETADQQPLLQQVKTSDFKVSRNIKVLM